LTCPASSLVSRYVHNWHNERFPSVVPVLTVAVTANDELWRGPHAPARRATVTNSWQRAHTFRACKVLFPCPPRVWSSNPKDSYPLARKDREQKRRTETVPRRQNNEIYMDTN
jgi:hypothetical protein